MSFFKPSVKAKTLQVSTESMKSATETLNASNKSLPHISVFPWKDLQHHLITLAHAQQNQTGLDDDPELNQMFAVMQEFVDYVKDDGFMNSFVLLASGYRENSTSFQQNASESLADFLNKTRNVSEQMLMLKAGKFLDKNAGIIHQFVKEMKGKMSVFVQSMPIGLLQTRTVDVLPELENITRLIDRPAAAKVARGQNGEESVDPDDFCVRMESLFVNSSEAVRELEGMKETINASQESIPIIGQFMEKILPDTPEAKDVGPRVVMLENQLLDTVYSIVSSLQEVTRGYDFEVGNLVHDKMKCQTQRKMEDYEVEWEYSAGHWATPTLASALSLAVALQL